jgi:hypothetical protein
MPEQPRKLPPLGFAGFEDSRAAAGRPRRKVRWSLRPMHEPCEGAGQAQKPSQGGPSRVLV